MARSDTARKVLTTASLFTALIAKFESLFANSIESRELEALTLNKGFVRGKEEELLPKVKMKNPVMDFGLRAQFMIRCEPLRFPLRKVSVLNITS